MTEKTYNSLSLPVLYLGAKTLYNTVVPIRGKPHIKPIGNRRKQHETIELFDSDKEIYSYKLYDTHVVRLYPNGDVAICTGGWGSMTTASFITWVTRNRFSGRVFNNKLWVSTYDGHWPMPDDGVVLFKPVFNGGFKLAEPLMVEKRSVDRAAAREARAPYREFMSFVKTMLTLSDGWLMPETIESVCPHTPISNYNWIDHRANMREGDILTTLDEEGEDSYLKVMVNLCLRATPIHETSMEFMGSNAYKLKYKPSTILSAFDRIIFWCDEPYKKEIVQANGTFCRNYV